MTIDDAPMDELDLAIRREAAALRASTEAAAHTGDAWDDFLVERPIAIVEARPKVAPRRRMIIAIGLVAAMIAAVVIARTIIERDSARLPVISPSPNSTVPLTTSGYAAVELGSHQELVAVRDDGTRTVIGKIPPKVVGELKALAGQVYPYTSNFSVSAAGWVAASSPAADGFWFFDLRHPERAGRFASIPGPPDSRIASGAWNPQGTMFGAITRDRLAVVVDPATGQQTQLTSTLPPYGAAPIWTADGTGILTGVATGTCDDIGRAFGVVPVTGGTETDVVPALASGVRQVAKGGQWVIETGCDTSGTDSSAVQEVVVSQETGGETWVSADDLGATTLQHSVFASTRDSLWVLGVDSGTSTQVRLFDVRSPHVLRPANTAPLPDGALGRTIRTSRLASIAPDDSAAVVAVELSAGTVITVPYYSLVPTDGSGPTDLRGLFCGFVPMSLVDELST